MLIALSQRNSARNKQLPSRLDQPSRVTRKGNTLAKATAENPSCRNPSQSGSSSQMKRKTLSCQKQALYLLSRFQKPRPRPSRSKPRSLTCRPSRSSSSTCGTHLSRKTRPRSLTSSSRTYAWSALSLAQSTMYVSGFICCQTVGWNIDIHIETHRIDRFLWHDRSTLSRTDPCSCDSMRLSLRSSVCRS